MNNKSFNNEACSCRVCGKTAIKLFHGKLLDLSVNYFECPQCGYVQTETPYWLETAYQNAINLSDTGIMSRNINNAKTTIATLIYLQKTHGKVADYAGGYGILVRLLRDYGIDAFWYDQYCRNLIAKGFEYQSGDQIDLVTVFEAFEHFVEPATELEKLLSIAPSILFSTEIISKPAPALTNWWYYGCHHGQHIGFFRIETLQFLAEKFNKKLYTNGINLHLISDAKPNAKYWRFLTHHYITKLIPIYARFCLNSKITSDHNLLSGPSS